MMEQGIRVQLRFGVASDKRLNKHGKPCEINHKWVRWRT